MDQPPGHTEFDEPARCAPDRPEPTFRLVTEPLAEVDRDIRELGLQERAYELQLSGYTVIRDALSPATVRTLREALLRLAGDDDGKPIDLSGAGHRDRTQEVVLLLTRGGEPFENLVLHPRALALITLLLGHDCTLSSLTGYVKGAGQSPLGVHSDTAYVPDPLAPYAHLANVNYCLTDYTVAGGCLTVVPGSHRFGHRPREGQGLREAVPVEVPAGSAIVFHGNTWHGAHARSTPALRLTLSALYCRMYMRPQERYDELVDEERLANHPARFRTLVGKDVPTGWRSVDEARRIMSLRRERAARYYTTRSEYS